MQADGPTQQQQEGREDSPPKRQKDATEERHVHFAGAFEVEDLNADGKRVQVYGQGLPGIPKRVFLEGYTNSPEFSRIINPVVHHNPDANDDDQNYMVPSKFANYQSPMDRQKADPLELRRMATFGAHLQAKAKPPVQGHNENLLPDESADAARQAPIVEKEEDLLMDEEDDEEPEDDTFEFLLR